MYIESPFNFMPHQSLVINGQIYEKKKNVSKGKEKMYSLRLSLCDEDLI